MTSISQKLGTLGVLLLFLISCESDQSSLLSYGDNTKKLISEAEQLMFDDIYKLDSITVLLESKESQRTTVAASFYRHFITYHYENQKAGIDRLIAIYPQLIEQKLYRLASYVDYIESITYSAKAQEIERRSIVYINKKEFEFEKAFFQAMTFDDNSMYDSKLTVTRLNALINQFPEKRNSNFFALLKYSIFAILDDDKDLKVAEWYAKKYLAEENRTLLKAFLKFELAHLYYKMDDDMTRADVYIKEIQQDLTAKGFLSKNDELKTQYGHLYCQKQQQLKGLEYYEAAARSNRLNNIDIGFLYHYLIVNSIRYYGPSYYKLPTWYKQAIDLLSDDVAAYTTVLKSKVEWLTALGREEEAAQLKKKLVRIIQSEGGYIEHNLSRYTVSNFIFRAKQNSTIEQLKRQHLLNDKILKQRNLIFGASGICLVLLLVLIYVFLSNKRNIQKLKFSEQEWTIKNKLAISRNKQIQKQANRLEGIYRKMEYSNFQLTELASLFSTELKEPAEKILDFNRKLYGRYVKKIAQGDQEHLESMVLSSQKLNQIVNGLSLYTNTTSIPNSAVETIDLQKLVEKVVSQFENTLNKQDGYIKVCTNLPFVIGYKTLIERLMVHLIDNALKFQKEGTPPFVQIKCIERAKTIEIAVKDNGIGINEAFYDEIFLFFRRLNGPDYKGSGLGLTICKKIIKLHKSDIWVESELGNGSTFKFTLPTLHDFIPQLLSDAKKSIKK